MPPHRFLESLLMMRSAVPCPTSQFRVRAVMVLAMVALAAYPAHSDSWPSWLTLSPTTPTGLAAAAAALQTLPIQTESPAVAVHATPEGHWQFTNRSGETFTAGTSAEIKRASAAVLPDATYGFTAATLVLSQDTLFTGPTVLKDLPPAKAYLTVIDGSVFPIQRALNATLAIGIRPGVILAASDQDGAREAFAQLRRPLDAARLRILSATPGAAATLSATPKFDASQNGAAIDAVEPDHLAEALANIPRQTAILTGRLDGASLAMLPSSGAERTVSYAALVAAAANADVDLLILHADPPRQPGGRNWLWQQVQVSGLAHATKRATFADFLDQLASGHDPFVITLASEGSDRVRLTAQPVPAALTTTRGVAGWLKQAAGSVTGQVTGAVEPAAIHASLVSMSRRNALSYRFAPSFPVTLPTLYGAALALGLAGLSVALQWWRAFWPSESRADYPNARGFVMAKLIRSVAFATVFLPLVALPAIAVRIWAAMKPKPLPQ